MISNTFVSGPVVPNLSDTVKLKVISADTLEVVCLLYKIAKKIQNFFGNLIVWGHLPIVNANRLRFLGVSSTRGTQLKLVKLSLVLGMHPAEGCKGIEVHLMFFLDLLPLVER